MILFKSKEIVQQGFKEVLITLCDESLLGKTLSTGLVISPVFYGGVVVEDVSLVLKAISKSSMVNAMGKESVDLLLSKGLITDSGVVFIGDEKVPHAIIFSGGVL